MALSDNLIAFWSLEEASGDAIDATGNGHTLTDVNTVTSTTGKIGNARQFTLANAEQMTSASVDFNNSSVGPFSVCAWVYFDSLSGFTSIASKAWFPGWVLRYRSDVNRFEMLVSSSGDFTQVQLVIASTATWYFVVGTYSGTAVGLSINGAALTTVAFSTLGNSSNPFTIGGAVTGGTPNMDGRIDQVGYWTRVITDAEITFLYNSGAGRTYAEIGPAPAVNDYRIIPPTLNFIQPAGQLAIVPATA